MNIESFYKYEKTLSNKKKRELGIVYTPPDIVDFINKKALALWQGETPPKVVDPCCGTGVFLYDMANKISKRWNIPLSEVYEKYIFGIDIDEGAISNAQEIFSNNINLRHASSLYEDLSCYDMIVTNPPYIRIQNLDNDTKQRIKKDFNCCVGDTDIYIAFLQKLTEFKGIVGLIAPNSWINNKGCKKYRLLLKSEHRLQTILNFKSKKVFNGVDTYTAIMVLDNKKVNNIKCHEDFDKYEEIGYQECFIDDTCIFNLEQMSFVKNINNRKTKLLDVCDISVGLATLADGVFMLELLTEQQNTFKVKTIKKINDQFHEFEIEKGIVKKCVKASEISKKEKNYVIVYPYKGGKLLQEDVFQNTYPLAYSYLEQRKDKLLFRDKGKGVKNGKYKWYEYGRSQGIKLNKEKLLLAPFVENRIQICHSSEDELFVSGYAVIPKQNIALNKIREIFCSDEINQWANIFSKNLSGGWKSLSKNTFANYKTQEIK